VLCLIHWLLKGIFKMWEGPSAVNTARSAFSSNNLEKSGSKIKGDSVGIINSMVVRDGLEPELAGIVRTY